MVQSPPPPPAKKKSECTTAASLFYGFWLLMLMSLSFCLSACLLVFWGEGVGLDASLSNYFPSSSNHFLLNEFHSFVTSQCKTQTRLSSFVIITSLIHNLHSGDLQQNSSGHIVMSSKHRKLTFLSVTLDFSDVSNAH